VPQPDPTLNEATRLHEQGALAEAAAIYRALLARDPTDAHVHNLLGAAELAMGRPQTALGLLDRAVALAPNDARYHLNRANARRVLGRIDDALADLARAAELKPDYLPAWMARGQLLAGVGRAAEAAACFTQAVTLRPDLAAAWHFRGLMNAQAGDAAGAVADFDRALQLSPQAAEIRRARGVALAGLGRLDDALVDFDALLVLNPDDAPSHTERGGVLGKMNRAGDALSAFDRALALNPADAAAHNGRGLALASLHRPQEAVAAFDHALAITPALAEARANRAQVLCSLKRFTEAASEFSRLMAEAARVPFLPGHRLAARLQACDWTDFEAERGRIAARVEAGEAVDTPHNFLIHSDSPALQLKAARVFTALACPPQAASFVHAPPREGKIRVAYLSADFNNHATALLAGRLFAVHDRSRFEIIGLSFSADDASNVYRELPAAFDRYIDVRDMSDRAVAAWMAEHAVDIAVDLKGHTAHSRPGIFAYHAAPLQVQFLGFPGTMGADYIDYLIADRATVPPEHRAHYSERIITLPGSYQVNDALRPRPDGTATRADHGLPATGFVFCAFNAAAKITPAMFDIWMRLLRGVEGSTLWLLDGGPEATANLRREATTRGVNVDRLVFAPRAPFDRHMARTALADLFLDTLPCNAHTTASDALWAGVPVLTCVGTTFTGRVAASLLHAHGVPELVTASLADYEALALRIARSPHLLADLKAKTAQHRDRSGLFDIRAFCAKLEAAFTLIHLRRRDGLAPDHIDVAAN